MLMGGHSNLQDDPCTPLAWRRIIMTKLNGTLLFSAAILLATSPAPAVTFTELQLADGFNFSGQKVAWGDFNNDGWVDMFAGGGFSRNNGGIDGLQGLGPIFNVPNAPKSPEGIWGDFDNDGFLDLFEYSNHRLWHNEGGTGFTDESLKIPALPMTVTRGAAWGDFNGDSYLDLYVGGYEAPAYQPDAILINNQGSGFSLAWTQSGDVDPARGITAADFDEDGDLDVYVSNYRVEQNQLWRNDGNANFTNVAPSYGVEGDYDFSSTSYGHTVGSAWGDLNNDGNLDLVVGNFSHFPIWQDRVQVNINSGAPDYNFTNINNMLNAHKGAAGIDWQESFASPALGDYDNDGDLDLFITTVKFGNKPILYANDGSGNFSDVSASVGLAGITSDPPYATYQNAWADFDNDGDLDLATNQKLYRNDGDTNNNWLKVQLQGDGTTVNRAAIGAQVRAHVGGQIMTRQVGGGTGEGNQNDLTMHFGLGSHSSSVQLEISWPDGPQQTLSVMPNQTKVLTFPVPELSDYAVWAEQHGLVQGPEGDDDGDGLKNLGEFGLGGNPTNAGEQGYLPLFGRNNGALEYTHVQQSDTNNGLRYYLELSDNLVSNVWTNAGYTVVGSGPFTNGFDAVTNRVETNVRPEQFIRLMIEEQ